MGTSISKKWMISIEAICFFLILCTLWADEIFDFPHLFFNLEATPIDWSDASIESVIFIFIAGIALLLTWKLSPKEDGLSNSKVVAVCAVCRKVCVEGRWISLDSFIESGAVGTLTHGICPDCMETYYKGVTSTTALNFKRVLKTRQTEED